MGRFDFMGKNPGYAELDRRIISHYDKYCSRLELEVKWQYRLRQGLLRKPLKMRFRS